MLEGNVYEPMLLYRCSSERNDFISYALFFLAKKIGYKQGIQPD
jgi:hypothetical protein